MGTRQALFLVAVLIFVLLAVAMVFLSGDEFTPMQPSSPAVERALPQAPAVPVLRGSPPPAMESIETPVVAASAARIAITGRVTSNLGDALHGARLTTRGGTEGSVATVLTGADGRYELAVRPIRTGSHVIRVEADGYEASELRIASEELTGAIQRDVQLTVLEGHARVTGRLLSSRGEGVEGAAVQLGSAATETRYTATTDRYGEFALPAVKPGSEYMILIRPDTGYEEYIERGVTVPDEGLELEIVVEPIDGGRLQGRVVGPGGEPVPDLSLSIRSDRASRGSLQATSDSSGYFAVENVPNGILTLSSGEPRLNVRGLALESGESKDVVLTVDWGGHAVSGRVVDDRGSPIANAGVELAWIHRDGAVISDSFRSVKTDDRGSFRFDGVGEGMHQLAAGAPGYESTMVEYDVGRSGPAAELKLRSSDR